MAVLTVTGASIGALSFAQTTPTLSCSIGTNPVSVCQAAILTATGGNGIYGWSGQNLAGTNSAGTQFAVSYSAAGIYPVTVTSAGQTATCNVNVVAGTVTTGALSCSPAVQSVNLGQVATVVATGGTGTYVWSSPDLSIANSGGSGFSANYASTGLKTLSVTSGGVIASCDINVLSGGTSVIPVVVTTPGLPNTGGQ